MRYILVLICLLTTQLLPANNLQLQAGAFQSDYFKSAAKYSISYENYQRSGLAFQIGISLMQSAKANQDLTQITLPYAGLMYYLRLPKLPFRLFFGAGFGLNHIPDTFGTNYVATYLNGGLSYKLSRHIFIYAKYQQDYGQTLNNGNKITFDSNTTAIGISMSLSQKKFLKKANSNQGSQMREQERKPRPKRNRNRPSAYKKTQDMMNDLSWPTY